MDLLNLADRTGDISLATAEFFEVTDFLDEENRKIGTRPFFRFTVYPNYFNNGVGADQGTFLEGTFVSPDRIQLDIGTGPTLWTSDTLTANVAHFPTTITISWDYSSAGYDFIMELRTSPTSGGLTTENWNIIENGDTLLLQMYYQLRIRFTSGRYWAFDTLEDAEASDLSAWAEDTSAEPNVTLDLMEYANDGAAQAAFVTNGGLVDSLPTDGTGVTADSDDGGGNPDHQSCDDNTGTRWVSSVGTNSWVQVDFGAGVTKKITSMSLIPATVPIAGGVSRIKDWELHGSTDNFVASNVTVTTGQHADNGNKETYDFSNTTGYRYYRLIISCDWGSGYNGGLTEWELFESVSLQSYSEATIKQEGSYSLKGIAAITNSLNKTLTRTVSPTINLTGKTTIKFDIRASRTGTNIKIGIRDSGGTTSEITPNIAAADTFQTVVWDISAVANANKDVIDSIIVTIVNADAANTFYIDNMFAEAMAYSYPDEYQGYAFISPSEGSLSYIENIVIVGELRLPDQDILDGGSLSLPVSSDFSSLISGDHSMTLLNRNNQYSPRHANFIFAGENDWQRKNIKIEMGFVAPDGIETGTIPLYVGNILKWGPVPLSISPDSYESGGVEIYSRDAISLFMDQQIGTPNDDGVPAPVVCGQIMREATKLGDNSLDTPVKDVNYEGDILTELSTVDLSGASNIIELSPVDPFEGLKCLRAYAQSIGYARGWIDLPAASDNVLFKTRIKFVSVPSPPIAYNMAFLKVKAGGSDLISLEVNSDYQVYLNYNGTRKETDWYINRNQDIWMDLTIGIYGKNPGVIRVSVDGDQIINYDEESGAPLNLTTLAVIQKIGLGVSIAAAETWEILFDNSKLYNTYYPEAYYVPGYPFVDIGSVYVDGVVKVEKTKNGITQAYSGGKAVDPINLIKIPAQGLVIFGDLANPPSGSVFLMMNKDTNTHPVDAIEAVLTAGGRDDLIDAASFAAAKAARPGDSVGCYFEETPIADAVLAISQLALLNVIISGGTIKLLPYDGAAPPSYDWVIDRSVCAGLSASDDSETKKNKVNVKWGQYDTNSRLFYTAQDEVSIAKLGPFEEELDFSWGNEVGSDNGDMARNRADCLLNRLKGSLVLYEDVIALAWKFIRVEIGDTAQVNIPYYGVPEIFRIVGKDITMIPPYDLTLSLALYPGEL